MIIRRSLFMKKLVVLVAMLALATCAFA